MRKLYRAKSKKRIFVVFLIIFGCMLGLVGKLAYIQFAMAGKLQDQVLDQRLRDVPVEPKRGIIYDTKGRELAVSASVDSIYAIPSEVENPEETAKYLAAELGMDEEEIYTKITRRRAFEWVKRKVEQDVGKRIRKLIEEKKVTGIAVTEESRRFYPKGMLAAHVIGFAGIDSQGLYGVEKTYDSELRGKPGTIKVEKDGQNRIIPYAAQQYIPPTDGNNIYLTIDEVIQHIAEREAEKALNENAAKNVSIVIMQPKTGAILALANRPSFDPNNYQEYDQSLWRNVAVSNSYEPGSTFKIVTTAASLQEKLVSESDRFYCPGYIKIPGSTIRCWKAGGHGSQTLAEVVQNSCNVGFVQMGLELGQEKFYEYVRNFGFGQKTDLDLIGEASGILIPESRLKSVDLARIAFGQSISVTPVQLVSAVSAVANGGVLLKPQIVKQITDSNGEIIKEFQPQQVRRVISKEIADQTLALLETVVSEGSGKNAQVPGYRIGGKTGTAQKVIDGRYAEGKYISSFIGIAPLNDPQIVVLVVIDEPSGGAYYGGQIAAPVAGNVMKDVLQYL
ncbi:MAG TPA: stage V sporulation protein D, partial [Clostridia bacterium]|nr:stage V sporulation protein D [Clostridia bacterium]